MDVQPPGDERLALGQTAGRGRPGAWALDPRTCHVLGSTDCRRTESWRFSHLHGNEDCAFSVDNGLLLIEGRDRRTGGTSAISLRCERLPIGCAYRSAATLRLRSGVSLRVFIEREGEGS